ncbi:hypothetical protein GCM10011575_43360 [Microlunatus endophyticus]|uniref:Uncharacterized protein n=1 Tax=Microlunatus endophyticus TaxID=1716077 RepID=A0A917SHN1_9ACTN|nr:hypothetical protein [Microlunatus endophyticus]GGL80408.1 hypothetical protein GCM10011575_43360 [Microlunatus endophyticus]
MALDDFYYETVVKQQAADVQARAARQQLIRIARTAAKRERRARREVRLLRDAVEGRRRGPWRVLRGAFTDRFPQAHPQPETIRARDASGGVSDGPAVAVADRQRSAGAR